MKDEAKNCENPENEFHNKIWFLPSTDLLTRQLFPTATSPTRMALRTLSLRKKHWINDAAFSKPSGWRLVSSEMTPIVFSCIYLAYSSQQMTFKIFLRRLWWFLSMYPTTPPLANNINAKPNGGGSNYVHAQKWSEPIHPWDDEFVGWDKNSWMKWLQQCATLLVTATTDWQSRWRDLSLSGCLL